MNIQNNEEMIGVLYNSCYGGFTISEHAIKTYNIKMLEIDSNYKPIEVDTQECYKRVKRHDPIMIEVYNQIGFYFNTGYSNVKVEYIKKKYEDFYYISEYDGLESVKIYINKYKVESIKKIVNNNDINSDEKINQIREIINETL